MKHQGAARNASVSFWTDRPLPEKLVRKIVAARLEEIARVDAERKTARANRLR
jgi:hypothetical protein